MEVKPGYLCPKGYKQTEAGVIPEEWDTASLLGVAQCLDNVRVPLNESQRMRMQGDIPYCGANGVLGFVDNYVIDDDIILMAEDGGYFDEYETRPIAYRMTGKCWVNNHAHILKAKPGFDQGFLFYSLVHKNIMPFLASGTRAKLNKSEMVKILVPAPPTEAEQRAIATALSDVDGLLGGLDRLIAKKRDLKQAAMQQLLTGQTRLPGFQGEWEVKRLGDVAFLSKGTQLHSAETDEGGKFPHLNGGITPSSYTNKSNTPANTIAISEGGNSCGFVQFMAEPYWCGGHCYSVIPNNIDNQFFYHALKGQQSAIMALRVGSGLPNVQKTGLRAFKISFPADLHEQTAIAEVLSDMDAELAALEQRRDKTRALKQAMMQELLTGRTRVV